VSAARDPDTILAAWLEEGPNELPYASRRAILTGVRTTTQAKNRFGWLGRWNELSRFESISAVTALAAAAMVVTFVALSGINRPNGDLGGLSTLSPSASAAQPSSPSPSPVSLPTPPWHAITSERFGYTIELPASWSAVSLNGLDWMPSDLYPGPDADYADRWQVPGSTSPWLMIAVRDPEPQERLDTWMARYGSGMVLACHATEDTVAVSSESGVLRIGSCTPGGLATMDVLVAHGNRAFSIQLNYPSQEQAVDRALLDQVLVSFRFTP
jgi:hypothetical protein